MDNSKSSKQDSIDSKGDNVEFIDFSNYLNKRNERINWMNNLYEFKNEKLFVDGQITTSDNKVIYVDRNVLSASSKYFKALFTNSIDPDHQVYKVFLPDVRSDIMEIIVEFAYKGKINGISLDNFQSLVTVIDRLGISGALESCYDFLIDSINDFTCITIYQLGRLYSVPRVIEAAKKWILFHCTRVTKIKEFSQLTSDELADILKDDRLNFKREELTYHVLMSWISYHNKRIDDFSNLIKLVRLGNANLKFIQTTVKDNLLVKTDIDVKSYIDIVEDVILDLSNDPVPAKFKPHIYPFLRPRIPRDIIFAFGGWSTSQACNYIETYDCRVNKWYLVEEIDPSLEKNSPFRAYHGMVYFKGLIYIIGGFNASGNNNTYFNDVTTFNPRTREWQDKSCMHVPRCYVSVAICKDFIYAMGGYDGTARISSVERYDYKTNQWEFVADMHHARSDACAACLNGKIYIVGGFNGNDVLQSAEVYDPDTNKWTFIAEMNRPRSGVQLVPYDSYLYVLAGNDGQSRQTSVERYNPYTDQWKIITHMRTPRSNFACVVLEGLIYVIGGFNGVTTIDEVSSYDPATGVWQEMWKMNVHRSALNACVVSELDNAKEYTWLRNELIQDNQLPYTAIINIKRRSSFPRNNTI